jgi:hypothetical protein
MSTAVVTIFVIATIIAVALALGVLNRKKN